MWSYNCVRERIPSMRKRFLRVVCVALVATFALILCACGKSGVEFTNKSDYNFDKVFISSTTSETWGDGPSCKAGETITLSKNELEDGDGVAYDVGALDTENFYLYEFYGVTLGEGYSMEMTVGGLFSTPTLRVTDANGNTQTYEDSCNIHISMG